jgi:hypothetical protein
MSLILGTRPPDKFQSCANNGRKNYYAKKPCTSTLTPESRFWPGVFIWALLMLGLYARHDACFYP